ncbi:MAG: histidinol phosphate phosphatase domain-containing protein [Deltaproteobacteria bacterium]|nr:histidinol phosphate phosphatase domain-containing protein [Deltaproteobacteria bacterium]
MLDLHTHSLFSDGELLPAELARRAEVLGHNYLAITDHAGPSNLGWVVEGALKAAAELNGHLSCVIIPGVELTHVPPRLIAPLAQRARDLGAKWVVVHGQTVVEPVAPGTNQAALEAGVDLLAHPGLLTADQAALAARQGVALELSYRSGHCLANGLVAALGRRAGAKLVVNSDAHAPRDLMSLDLARAVALGAGLQPQEWDRLQEEALQLAAEAAART